MAPVVARIPAVASLAGRPLDAFPIVSPEIVRTEFDRWNALGLTRADAERAAASAEAGGEAGVAPGVVAGFSSGSSGRPGLFLSSTKERGAYLGHLLARLLPVSAFLKPTRIALVLRADNRLYGDVAGAGRFRFLFQGLDVPGGEAGAADRLRARRPDRPQPRAGRAGAPGGRWAGRRAACSTAPSRWATTSAPGSKALARPP